MNNFPTRSRQQNEEDPFLREAHPKFSRATGVWVGVGVAVMGMAASAKAASDAKKANAAANASNSADNAANNAANYAHWLETQGIGPDGKPVNTILPRYATMSGPINGQRRFAKKGTVAAKTKAEADAAALAEAAKNGTVKVDDKGNRLMNLIDPLNLVGGKNKNKWDPVGFFG